MRRAFRDDPGFRRLARGWLRVVLAQEVRDQQHCAYERQHKPEGDTQTQHPLVSPPLTATGVGGEESLVENASTINFGAIRLGADSRFRTNTLRCWRPA
jgi:hypothetical protein